MIIPRRPNSAETYKNANAGQTFKKLQVRKILNIIGFGEAVKSATRAQGSPNTRYTEDNLCK